MSGARGGAGVGRGPWLAALALAMVWLAAVPPAIVAGRTGAVVLPGGERRHVTSESFDQDDFHMVVIRGFAAGLPTPDLVSYPSATAPGYHLLMAGIARVAGERDALLRLLSSLFGLGLVTAAGWTAARLARAGERGGAWWGAAAAACLPLALSQYTLGGAIWLTTDNAAWMLATLALSGALCASGPGLRAGVWSALAVTTRQIHVWLAAPVVAAGLLRAVDPGLSAPERRRALGRTALAAAAPTAVLAVFVWMWGGLTPRGSEAIRSMHASGFNPALPALALSVFGAFGVFFLGVAWREVAALRARDWGLWGALGLGLAAASWGSTTYDPEAGRWHGWVWEAVRRLPEVGGRSVVMLAAAPAGAACLLLLWRAARRAGRAREGLILAAALAGWMAAQSANSQAWQRYCEPMALLTLAWLSALAASAGREAFAAGRSRAGTLVERWWWVGPAGLGALQAALSVKQLFGPVYLGW